MKNKYLILIALILIGKVSHAQIITGSNGQIEIPNVTPSVGPLGAGSLLLFLSGDANTAIQENWGLNLGGDALRPVKVPFSSLLVGYTSGSANYGTGNAYISGVVGIGTTTVPPGYAFAVNGSAIATSFTVQSYGSWPDYVFKPSYQLPSLNLVKAYIDQNHHLPDVPSAEQVAKDGLNLGDMNKITMQKVEELTLYLIKKDEKIDEQQKQIDSLKEQLKSQDGHFKKLEDAVMKLTGSAIKNQ
jgi:hypothetical protein